MVVQEALMMYSPIPKHASMSESHIKHVIGTFDVYALKSL